MAVKTPDGALAQAWAADKKQGRLRRDPSLLDDIESDSRVRPMLKADFDRYCGENQINTDVPENIITQTISLMARAAISTNDAVIGCKYCPAP